MNPPAITIPQVPAETYLYHTTLAPRPKLILIGDSITEQGSASAEGWVTSLSIRYNRRLDVINRGMNGYNSQWGMAALPLILEDILGTRLDNDAPTCINHDCMDQTGFDKLFSQYTFVIGYGANDSCLPNGSCFRHHVPLDVYSSNIKQMVQMIQSWNKSNVTVALLTPPPCDTNVRKESRDNENVTALYAEKCIEVATEMNVPVVDLWNGMQLPLTDADSNNYGDKWKQDYLSDGLHLTPLGNFKLFQLVSETLETLLGLTIEGLPRHYPDHSLIDSECPRKTFDTSIK